MSLPSQPDEMVKPGDSIGLVCPTFLVDESTACLELLTLYDVTDAHVLWVSVTRSPEECCETWQSHAEGTPDRAAIVNVAAETRSTVTVSEEDSRGPLPSSIDPDVTEVAPPSDLTTLGVRITETLDAWDAADTTHQPVVCFDSLSLLLQYCTRDQMYAFLETLIAHFQDADAIAHYHLNSAAHDRETLRQVTEMFDMTYAYTDDEWALRAH